MKKINRVLYSLLFVSATMLSFSSCSEKIMNDINEDKNHANLGTTPAKFALTDAINSLGISVIGSDLSFYTMSYIEHEVGSYNQLYNAEKRTNEVTSSTTFNNTWITIYSNLESLRIIIEKCSEGGNDEGALETLGMAQVLSAHYLSILTDNWGDVPYSEAFYKVSGILQPKLDKQADVYTSVLLLLNKAIVNLSSDETVPALNPGSQDGLYNGKSDMWLKYAYSLKARAFMRLSKVSPDYNAVIEAIDNGFTSAADEAKLSGSFFGGESGIPPLSPYSAFFEARDYLSVSQSFADRLKAISHPMLSELECPVSITDTTYYRAGYAPNGEPEQAQAKYFLPVAAQDYSAPVYFLSYHEMLFIKAEALAYLGKNSEAKAELEKAVIAYFKKFESRWNNAVGGGSVMSAANAKDYFDSSVSARFDSNPLETIALEKYIALYGDGETLEAYADLRRNMAMDINPYDLKNPLSSKFPHRFGYGSDEVSSNPKVYDAYGDGSYVLSEKVWWAGGSR